MFLKHDYIPENPMEIKYKMIQINKNSLYQQ